MTAKAADIAVAEVNCTPAELTISWQNSTYSVYSSLWLRDNAPAHRDACTGQRLISLVDLPLEPRLQAAETGPPGHLTLTWDDGEISVFSLQSSFPPHRWKASPCKAGRMNDEQAADFLRIPFATAAITLRRWDDEAKIPGLRVPNAAHYLPILQAASRPGA